MYQNYQIVTPLSASGIQESPISNNFNDNQDYRQLYICYDKLKDQNQNLLIEIDHLKNSKTKEELYEERIQILRAENNNLLNLLDAYNLDKENFKYADAKIQELQTKVLFLTSELDKLEGLYTNTLRQLEIYKSKCNDWDNATNLVEDAKRNINHLIMEKNQLINSLEAKNQEIEILRLSHYNLEEKVSFEINERELMNIALRDKQIEIDRLNSILSNNLRELDSLKSSSIKSERISLKLDESPAKAKKELQDKDLQIVNWKSRFYELQDKVKLLIKENEKLNIIIEDLTKSVEIYKDKINNLESIQPIEKTSDLKSEDFQNLSRTIVENNKEKEYLFTRINELENICKEKIELENNMSKLLLENQRLNTILEEKSSSIEFLKNKSFTDEKINIELSELKVKVALFNTEKDKYLHELERKNKEIENLKIKLSEFEIKNKEIENLKIKLSELERKNNEIENLKIKLGEFENKNKEIENLKIKLSEYERKNKETENLKIKLGEFENKNKETEDLKIKLGEFENKNKEIENLKIKLSEYERKNKETENLKIKLGEFENKNKEIENLKIKLGEFENKNKEIENLKIKLSEFEKSNSTIEGLRTQASLLSIEIGRLTQVIDEKNIKINELTKRLFDVEKAPILTQEIQYKVENLFIDNENLMKVVFDEEEKNNILKNDLTEVEKFTILIRKVQEKLTDAKKQNEGLTIIIQDQIKEIEEIRLRNATLETKLDKINEYEEKIKVLEDEKSELKDVVIEKCKEVEILKERCSELSKENQELKYKLSSVLSDNEQLSNLILDRTKQIEYLKHELGLNENMKINRDEVKMKLSIMAAENERLNTLYTEELKQNDLLKYKLVILEKSQNITQDKENDDKRWKIALAEAIQEIENWKGKANDMEQALLKVTESFNNTLSENKKLKELLKDKSGEIEILKQKIILFEKSKLNMENYEDKISNLNKIIYEQQDELGKLGLILKETEALHTQFEEANNKINYLVEERETFSRLLNEKNKENQDLKSKISGSKLRN